MSRGAAASAWAVGFLCLAAATSPAIGARSLGVDVSHFQGSTGVAQSSWDQMAAEGKTFAFIKATEGLTGPDDATMTTNVSRAGAAGILTGVYHFAHPENRPTPAGAVQEADHFAAFAGSAIGPGHLRPVLDLERSGTLDGPGLTDWVLAFMNEVVVKDGPAAMPIVYTSGSFANFLDSRMAGKDLWLLEQTNPADPTTANPSLTGPGSFGDWAFWQYSGSGTAGGISPIDLNVVHTESHPLSSFVIAPEPAAAALLLACAASRVLTRRHRRGAVKVS